MTRATPRGAPSAIVVAFLLVGCVVAPAGPLQSFESPESSASSAPRRAVSAVSGGATEAGYPPVGYLLSGASETTLSGPRCVATLIAPNAAVTIPSCVRDPNPTYAVAFGAADKRGAVYPVRSVVRHPRRAYLAVLVLRDDVVGIEPAEIAPPTLGCGVRAIGYGQSDEAAMTSFGPRKSIAVCVDAIGTTVAAHAADGALCTLDGGAPLMREGSNEVAGIFAGYGAPRPHCRTGEREIFQPLDSEQAFIDCASSRGADTDAEPPSYRDTLCHWGEPFIEAMTARGLATSDPYARFNPERKVTRAELAALAVASVELAPIPTRPTRAFSDVPATFWAAEEVVRAYRVGLLSPTTAGTIDPATNVTRGDLIVGWATALRLSPPPGAARVATFDDEKLIAGDARPAFEAAIAAGLVPRDPDVNELAPNRAATRAEVTAVVHRARVLRGLEKAVASTWMVAVP